MRWAWFGDAGGGRWGGGCVETGAVHEARPPRPRNQAGRSLDMCGPQTSAPPSAPQRVTSHRSPPNFRTTSRRCCQYHLMCVRRTPSRAQPAGLLRGAVMRSPRLTRARTHRCRQASGAGPLRVRRTVSASRRRPRVSARCDGPLAEATSRTPCARDPRRAGAMPYAARVPAPRRCGRGARRAFARTKGSTCSSGYV